MSKISNIEKGAFLSLFNRGGYVLNFSTDSFDVFTQNSICLALCNHYGLSKGKSLTAYVNEASESDVIKLLSDLLDYYELYYQSEIEADEDSDGNWFNSNKEYRTYYKKCRATMDRIKLNITPFTAVCSSCSCKPQISDHLQVVLYLSAAGGKIVAHHQPVDTGQERGGLQIPQGGFPAAGQADGGAGQDQPEHGHGL